MPILEPPKQLHQLGDIGGDVPRFARRSRVCRRLAERIGPPFLPLLLATRFPQKKILQDEFPIAGSKRRIANPASYFAVAGFRSGFGFHDLIKRVAVGALEKRNSRG
jgi:hypothetical protein